MKILLRALYLFEVAALRQSLTAVIFTCFFAIAASAQVPVISSFSPTSGPLGSTVTITGSNFDPNAANNIVYFGAVRAKVTAASSTSLSVEVPNGATYEPITVTTNRLTAYANTSFSVTFINSNGSFSPGSFSRKLNLTGTNVHAINGNLSAIADFDIDGKPDVALLDHSNNKVSIFRNISTAGSIQLASKVDISTGAGPIAIKTGDIDGDGKLDLVIATEYSGYISVFRNVSTAENIAFAAPVNIFMYASPTSVAIGDLDNDGKPDLVFTNLIATNDPPIYGSMSVFKNTSTPGVISFGFVKVVLTGYQPSSVIISDLDGDGYKDIGIGNHGSDTISLFENTSNSSSMSFADKIDLSTADSPFSLQTADVDGDSKPELVVTYFGLKSVSIFKNISSVKNLTFTSEIKYNTPGFANTLAISDLDGDGKPDLAVGSTASTVSLFKNISNTGNVAFADKVDLSTSDVSSSISAGDLDGDGRPDLVLANIYSTEIFQNQTTPHAAPQPPAITSFSPTSGPVGTPVTITGTNFDPVAANNIVYFGAVKAVVTAATSTSLTVTVPAGATYQPVSVTTNNLTAYSAKPFMPTFSNSCPGFASNTFAEASNYPSGSDPRNLATADFDGDGKADIAITNIGSNTVSLFLNTSITANISFAPKTDLTTGAGPERVATADFDGDGKVDIVVANGGSGTVSVFRNISSRGILSFAAKVDYATGNFSRGVAIGDFDGDGRPDIVGVNTSSNTISFLRNTSNTGSISFAGKLDYATGSGPHAIAVGDLDGDNKPDVAVANLNSNTVSIFRNLSTGSTISFTLKTDYPLAGNNSYGIAIGDLDGDNKADLVVTSLVPGTASIFRNTSIPGSIALSPRIDFPLAYAPLNVAIADLDGDGKPDLGIADFQTNNFSILKNASSVGAISFDKEVAYGTGSPSTNIVIVDLDGDGKPDVATSAYTKNSLTIFRNQNICVVACTTPTFLNNNQIVLDASCGNNDGNITIQPTCGVGPFMYSIDGGAHYVAGANNGHTFANLTPGTYRLRLKDANGHESEIIERTVRTIYNGPTFIYNTTPATLTRNGSISITPTSGTGLFMYSLDAGNTYVAGPATGYTFNNLAANTYYLRIKNAEGCESAIIYEAVSTKLATGNQGCIPPTFKDDGTIVLDASCGNNDGQISIIPTSGAAPFMYSIDGGLTYKTGANTGAGYTNLAPGTYRLRIKDAKGCESAVIERTVRTIYNGPTFIYNTTPATLTSNGSISITPTSGTGLFMYSLDAGNTYVAGPATGYTFNNLAVNTYYLRIKNAAGCESAIVYEAVSKNGATGSSTCSPPTFKNDATIVLDASCGNNDGQISIIPTSGTAPFMYSINGGLTYKTGANTGAGYTNLALGTYKLRLKDSNGCESAIVERTIRAIYGGPTFTYKTSEATCGNKNGSITIVPTSGTGPFMYSIDAGNTYVQGASTGYTFTNLAPNTYYLRVKSAAGCESAIIYEAVKANFSNCTGVFVQANITALQMAISPEVVSTDAIKAYPNPTKGQFKLQVKGFTSSKAEVSIFNGEGKLVQKRQLNGAGTNTVDFDLRGHAKGMYYIKITSNSGTRTSKVLVQ